MQYLRCGSAKWFAQDFPVVEGRSAAHGHLVIYAAGSVQPAGGRWLISLLASRLHGLD